MTIDVDHQLNAVARSIGSRTLEAGEARVLTVTRDYDTDVKDLWDACTNPERIPRWFLPVNGDLREGGRYNLEGNAEGTIESCDPPRSFAATWEFGGQTSWIEVRLSEVDGRTRFTLEHLAHVDDELWDQYGPGAVGVGWDGAILGLSLHLADPEKDMSEVQKWTMSDEGKRFMSTSSNLWKDASIAFGTDPESAEAAAARTTAFFAGMSDTN